VGKIAKEKQCHVVKNTLPLGSVSVKFANSLTFPWLAMVLVKKSVQTLSTFGTRMEEYSGFASDG